MFFKNWGYFLTFPFQPKRVHEELIFKSIWMGFLSLLVYRFLIIFLIKILPGYLTLSRLEDWTIIGAFLFQKMIYDLSFTLVFCGIARLAFWGSDPLIALKIMYLNLSVSLYVLVITQILYYPMISLGLGIFRGNLVTWMELFLGGMVLIHYLRRVVKENWARTILHSFGVVLVAHVLSQLLRGPLVRLMEWIFPI